MLVYIFYMMLFPLAQAEIQTSFDLEYPARICLGESPERQQTSAWVIADIPTHTKEEFEFHRTCGELVQGIMPREVMLRIISPHGQSFRFVQSIEVYMQTASLPDVKVAYLTEVSEEIDSELVLVPIEQNLTAYLCSEKIRLKVAMVSDEAIPEKIHINLATRFKVHAHSILR